MWNGSDIRPREDQLFVCSIGFFAAHQRNMAITLLRKKGNARGEILIVWKRGRRKMYRKGQEQEPEVGEEVEWCAASRVVEMKDYSKRKE